ncbi:LiaI-LiaF-like domain-containing protein [Evansella cellulosilytica]|uniref:LiaI-LiaF-like transmembrane region domain-containing protein n=1 Tax=Evansella cellulosilytica (strain ATCC 21833 / DSM 2522 / FERM P-1141 / JCM 9156 / N-4) TaxID=649639 RepID=E6TZR8_EVAC2|nr:DUF5668 domain-containing protein [Evansella cellulosilytica]ADU31374.1 hypothetical protein Bcell_3131 [Evansella cellulosilytica DSM 2522]
MKNNNNLFPGIILISVGLYFLLRQFNISFPFSDTVFTWPSILVVIGIVLAFQGFSNRDDTKMFSGSVLLGLGVFFHGAHTFSSWGYHWGYFTLIISIAFFMKYFVHKKDGLTPAIVLLIISGFALYSDKVFSWLNNLTSSFDLIWPIALVVVGIYVLFFKKR